MNQKKQDIIIFIPICLVTALSLVISLNLSYWYWEPFPGGFTAREVAAAWPTIIEQIDGLVRDWSLPLFAIAFFSLFGFSVSMITLPGEKAFITALLFFYPIGIFFALQVGGELLILFLFLPLLVSTCLLALVLFYAIGRRKKELWITAAVLIHNLVFTGLWHLYFGDMYSVYGG